MRQEILTCITNAQITAAVNLDHKELKDDDIPPIITALKTYVPHLEVLSLDYNNLNDNGATLLAQSLADHFPKLRQLSLQFNKLDKQGIASILSLKKINPSLDILLHGNKIISVTEIFKIEQEISTKDQTLNIKSRPGKA